MENPFKRKNGSEADQPKAKKPKTTKEKNEKKNGKNKNGKNNDGKNKDGKQKKSKEDNDKNMCKNNMDRINKKLEEINSKREKHGKKSNVEFVKEKSINNGNYLYNVEFNYELNTKQSFSPTALVRLEEKGIKHGPVRSFFDSGANPSLISYELAKKLKFQVTSSINRVSGIEGVPFVIKHKATMNVHP